MPESIIEIKDLVKDYGSKRAVDHLDLEIAKGEIFGLLGPNGAGKTTIILTLLGLSEPTSGSVMVRGFNATSEPLKVKRITGYLPDEVGFAENSSGLESLVYTAMLNGFSRKNATKAAEELLETVGLSDSGKKQTKTYSKGMRQRLGLADVLIKKPEIIILDEPTVGIDPKGIQEFLDMIRDLSKNKGITVLLSSHILHQIEKICDRVGILVNGQLRAQGNIHQLAIDLFDNGNTSFKAEVKSVTDELIEALNKEELVHDIERQDNFIFMNGPKEAAPVISETILRNGGKLYSLSFTEHGLDDIYNHYFKDYEGGV